MSNFIVQGRSAATATMAALFLAGHTAQAQAAPIPRDRPVIRLNFIDGSHGDLPVLLTGSYSTPVDASAGGAWPAYVLSQEEQQFLQKALFRSIRVLD